MYFINKGYHPILLIDTRCIKDSLKEALLFLLVSNAYTTLHIRVIPNCLAYKVWRLLNPQQHVILWQLYQKKCASLFRKKNVLV